MCSTISRSSEVKEVPKHWESFPKYGPQEYRGQKKEGSPFGFRRRSRSPPYQDSRNRDPYLRRERSRSPSYGREYRYPQNGSSYEQRPPYKDSLYNDRYPITYGQPFYSRNRSHSRHDYHSSPKYHDHYGEFRHRSGSLKESSRNPSQSQRAGIMAEKSTPMTSQQNQSLENRNEFYLIEEAMNIIIKEYSFLLATDYKRKHLTSIAEKNFKNVTGSMLFSPIASLSPNQIGPLVPEVFSKSLLPSFKKLKHQKIETLA